jgi:regulator of protease activity HflC (stomatin/prohibitin superfamily)
LKGEKTKMRKFVAALLAIIVLTIGGIIIYCTTHETIPAGYVGFVYDRNAKAPDDNVIDGTSVINQERVGRIKINPITQDVLEYPTTYVARNWTRLEEGDNKVDMSMQIPTKEGKNVEADIYLTVQPINVGKIIKAFGTKDFDSIVDNDIYGLVKGKLSTVSQESSIYDIQTSRGDIQNEVISALSETLENVYGVKLIRFEIGTLVLPADIQAKIDQKTQAQNEVELAKLERQKQDEINQQLVDEQKAKSEKELLERKTAAEATAYEKQTAADASAYERKAAAEAELAAQEAKLKTAELQVEQARLEKEAELERQKSFTESYFRDKELDVEMAAVKAINSSVETIITSGNGEGYSALIGIDRILNSVG